MKANPPTAVALGDLGRLTLRANVAYAVRCAQRLIPCFKLPANAPRAREQMAAVARAVRVAEAFCQGLPGEPGQAAAAARLAGVAVEETGELTSFAGYAAVRAAEAAAYAEEVIRNPSDSGIMSVVAAAFGAGRVLAANADAFTVDLVAAAMRADVDKLGSMAQGSCADLGPAVDPSESGPLGSLWPDGAPAWYSVEQG